RHPGTGNAVYGAAHRPTTRAPRRGRSAAQAQHRHIHSTHLLYWPARGGGARTPGATADRGTDYHGTLARRRGLAYRPPARTGWGRAGAAASAIAGAIGSGH